MKIDFYTYFLIETSSITEKHEINESCNRNQYVLQQTLFQNTSLFVYIPQKSQSTCRFYAVHMLQGLI